METKKLLFFSVIAGSMAVIFPSCEPESPVPADPSYMDSIWSDPNDTTDTGGSGDSTYTYPGDSTVFGGGTDTTGTGGGGWGDPGDSTVFGGGGGGTDTTFWGDSTVFGG